MSTPLRVLVVEDNEDDCDLLLRELKRGNYAASAERVDTPEALCEAFDRREWDIVFADYTMPRFSGTKALSLIRSRGSEVPFIFVSGTIGEETAVAAIKAGAQDYIMKGSLQRLLPAVERELRETRLKHERVLAEEERRQSDARYRNILTIAGDAIIAVDEEQRITVFNQGAERSFGYTAAEVTGRPLELLLPERFIKAHQKQIEQFGTTDAGIAQLQLRREVFARRKNGDEFPADASISRLNENGRTTFTVILRDITESKRVEQELRLLLGVAEATSEAGDVLGVLSATMRKVCETTDWAVAQAWIPNTDGDALECSQSWYWRGLDLEAFRSASLNRTFVRNDGLPGLAWSSKQTQWLSDIASAPDFPRAEDAASARLISGMALPVMAGDDVIGVLEFFSRERHTPDARWMTLYAAVSAQVGNVIERKRTVARLHHLAHHDPLTGLANRMSFMERLKQSTVEADRYHRLASVAFIDLDRFKTINDSLGHGVGDELLKGVAERLASCVRQGDTVARLAGDEFTVILSNLAQASHAVHVAQKILDSFARPFRIGKHELYTSASLGMTFYPLDASDVDGLLRNADIAMYRAKKTGGNAYAFFSTEMTSQARARLTLETALRGALERDEFRLHYQPVVNLSTGRMESVEALIRWHYPGRGLVSPLEFIPLAEETGLIAPIGAWVLRTACLQAMAFKQPGQPPLRVAVNVSPRQFEREQLLDTVSRVLAETGFDPHRLTLEITESLLLQNPDTAIKTMRDLHALGVEFSIDDFGTGYSSFGYLKRLPIGHLKIDKSFIDGVPADLNAMAIVKAMLSMAKNLGLRVIAEGVETEAQLEFLAANGCDSVQGYAFSRPVPAVDLALMIEADKRFKVAH